MLDLSNNRLEGLQNDSLAGLPALRQLYLGENQIRRIQAQAFSANSSIVRYAKIILISCFN
jgi:Leucine-rich repeat (LRR) protein